MKLRSLEDFNNKNEYILALKICNGKYGPCVCYPVYADNGLFFVNQCGVILPYHVFSYVENGKDIFGNSNKFMITFDKYMECNDWCLNQNK